MSDRVAELLQRQVSSPGDALTPVSSDQPLIAQVYSAVYTEGLGPGVVQGT